LRNKNEETNMLTSDRITPRQAGNALTASTPRHSRIEDYAAQIAKIVERQDQLEVLSCEVAKVEKRGDQISNRAHAIHMGLTLQSKALGSQKVALEDAISWETPSTMREAFMMMLLVGGRNANAGQEESEAVDRLLQKITLFLEDHTDTSARELGLESFIAPEREWTSEALDLIKRGGAEPYAEASSC
jgi:hypothetical protein